MTRRKMWRLSWTAVFVWATCLTQAADPVEDLEGYWAFHNGRNANDLSGNGRNGVPEGDVQLIDDDGAPIPRTAEGCAEFGKKFANMIDCGPAPQIAEGLTLMAWANPDQTEATQFIAGAPYDDGAGWDAPWVAYQIGVRNGRMATWLNLAATDREYDSGAAFAEEWHHYAFVFHGDRANSYVDGFEVANMPDRFGEIKYDGDPHFVIGDRSLRAPGEPFGGLIDEVVLYSRALDEDEINDVMDRGIALAVRPQGKAATAWAYLKTVR